MLKKIKPVGIRKDRVWLLPVAIILSFSVIVAALVFWLFYGNEFKYEYLLNNGVEVEATVINYNYDYADSTTDGSVDTGSGWYYTWECRYNDRRYVGKSGYFRTEELVSQYMGKKFTVTVDPDSSFAVAKSKSEILAYGFHYREYLTCAIIFTCLLPLITFATVKFAFYPVILDSRIDRSGKLPKEGEVIKTRKFIISYVKVRYINGNGKTQEKWSYAWFTEKEAEFLRQKKTITIIPYKNTFGIQEEMPAKIT